MQRGKHRCCSVHIVFWSIKLLLLTSIFQSQNNNMPTLRNYFLCHGISKYGSCHSLSTKRDSNCILLYNLFILIWLFANIATIVGKCSWRNSIFGYAHNVSGLNDGDRRWVVILFQTPYIKYYYITTRGLEKNDDPTVQTCISLSPSFKPEMLCAGAQQIEYE